MQRVTTLELLRRSVRSVACTRCSKRPPHSGPLLPQITWPCETECTILANLPRLAKIAHDNAGDRRAPIERHMREQVCLNCHAGSSLTSDCQRQMNRECPLSIFLLDVIASFERILAMRSRQESAAVRKAQERKSAPA